jgi:hypothetical protein
MKLDSRRIKTAEVLLARRVAGLLPIIRACVAPEVQHLCCVCSSVAVTGWLLAGVAMCNNNLLRQVSSSG